MIKANFVRLVVIGFSGLICYNVASAQIGFKLGLAASSFSYKNKLYPDLGFEVDLRPYLGYDIEWIQTGDQKPIFSPYISIFYSDKWN